MDPTTCLAMIELLAQSATRDGPMRWLMLLAPVGLAITAMRNKTGVGKFIQEGAVSPETARRPQSIGIQRMFYIDSAIRKGVLLNAGDGRYFANMRRVRRIKRIRIATLLVAFGGGLALAIWLV